MLPTKTTAAFSQFEVTTGTKDPVDLIGVWVHLN
jgi:hypothetical protein